MLIILSIIAGIVAILIASYHLQKFGKDRYHYSIFSIGGMGVSFLGAIAILFACAYYHQGLMLQMVVAVILGVAPYIAMLVRDKRKTTITIAIAALILRFTISAVFIVVILWYSFMRGSSDEKQRAIR